MEQVLEHTQNPVDTLISVKAYCKPDTILRITVPNVARYGYNDKLWVGFPFNGRTIHIMSPFEHLQGFNPKSLEIILNRAGLVRDNSIRNLLTKPLYSLRYLTGRILPSVGPTVAVVHFNNDQSKVSSVAT